MNWTIHNPFKVFFWLFSFCQAVLHQRKQRKHLWQIWFSNQIINKQKQREEIERLFFFFNIQCYTTFTVQLELWLWRWRGFVWLQSSVFSCFLTALRLQRSPLLLQTSLKEQSHRTTLLSHTLQTTSHSFLCLCGQFTQHLYISPKNRLKERCPQECVYK